MDVIFLGLAKNILVTFTMIQHLKVMRNRILRITSYVLLLYLLSYITNSALGRYLVIPSGETRFAFGKPTAVSMPDMAIWTPQFGRFESYLTIRGDRAVRATIIGYLFCPLIYLDRRFFHKSFRVTDQLGFPLEGIDIIKNHR